MLEIVLNSLNRTHLSSMLRGFLSTRDISFRFKYRSLLIY